MPLPSYAPRSDNFGNWYFGGFQMDSQVEVGYGAGTALTATQAEFNTFLNSALGSANWVNSGNNYYYRFANSYEPLTGTISTTQNYRFSHSGQTLSLNTTPSSTPVLINNGCSFAPQTLWLSGYCGYAVANQYGMWVVYGIKSTSGTLGTAVGACYYGWAKNPVFPTNTTERVRNLILGEGSGNTSQTFLSTRAASTTDSPTNCITNSVISCQVSTPGANTTDLSVLDPLNSYLNIGSLYNSVFYPGSNLTLGRLYRIPPNKDPDGNTEQNIWLCAGQVYGWNGSSGVANAGYKLIRVWSNNIT
jgi:hypothetical protein